MTQKKLRIFGPLLLIAFLLLFFYGMMIHGLRSGAIYVGVVTFYAFMAWESTRLLVMLSRKKHPGIRNTNKRLFWLLLVGLPAALFVGLLDHLISWILGTYVAL